MKKTILILLALNFIFHLETKAQSLGVTGGLLTFLPKYPDAVDMTNYNSRKMGHTSAFTPGFRMEANAIDVGDKPARLGYVGIGISYFLPHVDSTFFMGSLSNGGGTIPVVGTRRITGTQFTIHAGYHIPFPDMEFLTFHFGLGLGYLKTKSKNILPEKSATFNFVQSDFDKTDFIPVVDQVVSVDLIFGAMYEFEKFYLTAQYNYMGDVNIFQQTGEKRRQGFMFGIYYPLKRFE